METALKIWYLPANLHGVSSRNNIDTYESKFTHFSDIVNKKICYKEFRIREYFQIKIF